MGQITVVPEDFVLVDYSASEITSLASDVARDVGLADVPITITVDETTPLARVVIRTSDPADLLVEGGAFEEPKKLRSFSPVMCRAALVRALFRVADRRTSGFADAPDDASLSLAQASAWDVWSVGRSERLGYPVQRARLLYSFRNRHGFTDVADTAFDELWNADSLTWADIARLCDLTSSAR